MYRKDENERVIRDIYGTDPEKITLMKHEKQLIRDTQERYLIGSGDHENRPMSTKHSNENKHVHSPSFARDEAHRMSHQRELLSAYNNNEE